MFDAFHLMPYPDHGNNIKAQLPIYLMFLDVSIGSNCQITYLLGIYGFLGLLVFLTRAGLYFYHNQRLSIRRNGKDIQIPLAGSPVSVDNDIAFILEIEALGGIGVGHVFGCKDADGSMAHKNYMTSKFGLNLGFNIGKAKQFTLAVKPAIVYNIEGRSQSNNAVAFNSNKANFELMAGLAYHFKTSNGTHHFTYARLYDQNEIDGLNDKINNLRGELDGKDNDLKAANNRINDLNNEVERLKNRKPNEVRVVETVTQQTRSMESVVTFRQGKSTVDNAQLPNVERVATYLNNHKDATVIIRGFASPEGSQEVNERIAKARAEAVKDILVKRYRINASRIDAQGNGVGDMFSEPDWNRVSICTIDDKEK